LLNDLEEAIGIYDEALRLRPEGHEDRSSSLNDLGDALWHFCYYHEANEARANRCIEVLREGLHLRPPGHPLRDQSLHNLARSLRSIRHQHLGQVDVFRECAWLNREALQLRPDGHPERLKSMGNLACDLHILAEHTGDMEMWAEVVSTRREVLRLRPPGHSLRRIALNNLGIALYNSFERLGGSDILAEATSTLREAMQLRPMGHPTRFSVLENLARALSYRSQYEGHLDSLLEAIKLKRMAVQLLSDSHPERARIVNSLADSLLVSFRNSGDREALVEAINLFREAVALRPPESLIHSYALNDLAEALEAKFDKDGQPEALSEAADLFRGSLDLRPAGHWRRFMSLEGLARVLCKIGSESWCEGLSTYQEALRVCPMGYPARARLLSGMSRCFLDPTSPFFSLSQGISCLSQAYAHTFTHISGRLKSAVTELQQLEVAYCALKGDHTEPHISDNERILDLYAQVIGLLPLAANFGLYHSARLQALTGCDEIARSAASRAMLLGRLPQAVEMLEQGRGVFWTQTLHLRTTAFDGVPDDHCQELKRMLHLLDFGAYRVESQEYSAVQREQELETRRQLNDAVQALITKIRAYPGLDRFLLSLLGSGWDCADEARRRQWGWLCPAAPEYWRARARVLALYPFSLSLRTG
jgi:tetratricopeptide (TPR) repeat protein